MYIHYNGLLLSEINKGQLLQKLVNNPLLAYRNALKIGLVRAFFYFFYYAIAIRLPAPGMPGALLGHWSRRLCAKHLFGHCGSGVRIAPRVIFGLGDRIQIGNNSNLGYGCRIIGGDLIIGDYVMMAPDVLIITENHEFGDINCTMWSQGQAAPSPVRIGNDVWIGARSIILPAVEISDHSVIGAGSIVTKNVPAWSVVAGVPAHIIRMRR